MALGAKLNLGFIDGKVTEPKERSNGLIHWTQYDHMIQC